MESTVKESIKLLLISFIISLLVSMFSDFDLRIGFFVYVFVYSLSFLLVPYWLRNNNMNRGTKLFLTIFIGIISITAIAYIYGIGKTLYRYTVVFCLLIITLLTINCIKKKI
jgi:hypothetical protein